MTETSPSRPRRRFVGFLVGFAISLAIGKLIETVTNKNSLQGLYDAQSAWLEAVKNMSPFRLGEVFLTELGRPEGGWHYLKPIAALWSSGESFFEASGLAGLLQIGMGVLAFVVTNLSLSKGKAMWMGKPGENSRFGTNVVLAPFAVVAASSVLALVLQAVMYGALTVFHWVTGLAAMAAGASGVVGFCWYCLSKLSERGAEHALTPKV